MASYHLVKLLRGSAVSMAWNCCANVLGSNSGQRGTYFAEGQELYCFPMQSLNNLKQLSIDLAPTYFQTELDVARLLARLVPIQMASEKREARSATGI